MRMILAAIAIGMTGFLAGTAVAQEDTQAPLPADSVPGQLDNATDDDQTADQVSNGGNGSSDAFPDSTRIPEPSESGPPVDTSPNETRTTDTAQGGDNDEPH